MAKSKRLYFALSLLAPIHIVILGAAFFSPYDPGLQNRELPFVPPMRLHWISHGRFHIRPFVYPYLAVPGRFAVYTPDTKRAAPVYFFVRSTGPRFSGGLHFPWRLFGAHGGTRIFLLGSDEYGRDQLSRILYGAQISLLAGLAAAMLSVGLGLLLGSVSGFYGGLADGGIMRLAELFLALPWLYLLFALRAFLPLDTPPQESFLLVIAAIGFIGWARPARLIRGAVLSAKERNFVLAARGFGASDMYLLRRHVLPQTFGIALTQAGLLIPQYILAEVALSYLGLGMGDTAPSLGNMLAQLQVPGVMSSYWWMLLPAAALIPLLAGYYSLAAALHERLDLTHVS
jgi:peptide/nickel transport system permease protein